jgi:hypothetical protein
MDIDGLIPTPIFTGALLQQIFLPRPLGGQVSTFGISLALRLHLGERPAFVIQSLSAHCTLAYTV